MDARHLLLSLTFTTSISSYATNRSLITWGEPIFQIRQSSDDIKKTFQRVKQQSFPELDGERISYLSFLSKSSYFQTRFSVWNLFWGASRKYSLMYNRRLEKTDVPIEALEAIMAHELVHIVYYKQHRNRQLWKLIPKYLNKNFRRDFERETDKESIRRGYAEGLIAYREWLYPRLSINQLKIKKYTYLNPEEIRDYAADLE